jgi:hypothetical protein
MILEPLNMPHEAMEDEKKWSSVKLSTLQHINKPVKRIIHTKCSVQVLKNVLFIQNVCIHMLIG